MKHSKCGAMLIIRLLTGGVFLAHGLPKLLNASEGMANFVGGAFHDLGLTFLSHSQWLMALGIGEVLLGTLILLGLGSCLAAPVLVVIMFGAMKTKSWSFPAIELDIVVVGMLLAIFVGGNGKFALDRFFGNCSCSKENGTCCKTEKKSTCSTQDHDCSKEQGTGNCCKD